MFYSSGRFLSCSFKYKQVFKVNFNPERTKYHKIPNISPPPVYKPPPEYKPPYSLAQRLLQI